MPIVSEHARREVRLITTYPRSVPANLPKRLGRQYASGVQGEGSADQAVIKAGELGAAISNAVVRIRAQHRGRGPTRAKTYLFEDVILTVMEEGAATVERSLIDAGQDDLVRNIRSSVQAAMSDELKSAVEEITGRTVRVVVTGSEIEMDIDCIVFLLEPGTAQPRE
jgi:uncharacterized protein YbcI